MMKMPSKSKRKGTVYESELVKLLNARGIPAERAWGSNGRALGESEGVDIVFTDRGGFRWKVQAKRRAKLAEYVKPPAGANIVIMREDRGENLVVLPMDIFLDML